MYPKTLAIALAAASVLEAQVPTRTYAKHDVEYAEPFSQIVGLRELSDGRVVIADARDKILQIIDFKGGAPKKIGREGSGPGEWLTLSRLLAYPGDTTLMPDQQNNRMLVIAPDGTPVRTMTPPAAPSAAGTSIQISGSGFLSARFADARGRLYYQETAFGFSGNAPPGVADSSPVVRHDLKTHTTDTITYVKRAPAGKPTVIQSGGGTISTTVALPFAPLEVWGALPDGRVVVARPTDYHVEFAAARGPRTAGARVQYTPVPVTAAEKKAYIDRQKAAAAGRRAVVNGVAITPPAPPEPTEWPPTLPPFEAGALFTTPAGETWVLRARGAADLVPTFDVFNGEGRNIARVVLPKGTTLAGFGAKSVYLFRTDDDGLQYLQRYSMQ
jgi:hypothetical protein